MDVFDIFFFQAEDGIRDAQESRGLGDVYKRQEHYHVHRVGERTVIRPPWRDYDEQPDDIILNLDPVSYTHLTLPTIYSV